MMPVYCAGDLVQETDDFRCSKCYRQVHVMKGRLLPKCPHCGNSTFDVPRDLTAHAGLGKAVD